MAVLCDYEASQRLCGDSPRLYGASSQIYGDSSQLYGASRIMCWNLELCWSSVAVDQAVIAPFRSSV
ncbi:hypothetical protein [Pseudogracilibacillus auburnensis]|uniref:hypothetical protein n=1 Tax=Pseudogracilibacillus auburnensis TaxID=1494959 RepID=UPI001A975AFF|nr:hypothetical protein [Pseudogracilibacillus auburnensis]MBO1002983.1 hypothetical protein [Pseudogracilibacillus auburnensis]